MTEDEINEAVARAFETDISNRAMVDLIMRRADVSDALMYYVAAAGIGGNDARLGRAKEEVEERTKEFNDVYKEVMGQ